MGKYGINTAIRKIRQRANMQIWWMVLLCGKPINRLVNRFLFPANGSRTTCVLFRTVHHILYRSIVVLFKNQDLSKVKSYTSTCFKVRVLSFDDFKTVLLQHPHPHPTYYPLVSLWCTTHTVSSFWTPIKYCEKILVFLSSKISV